MSSNSFDQSRSDDADLPFLAAVRDALQERDQVPRQVREAGYAAFAWRNVDAELAELLYDSATADLAASGARSDQANVRAMTFASDQVTIELELDDGSLLGQIVPVVPGEVVIVVDGEPGLRAAVDEVGAFRLRPLPAATFRLRFEGAGVTILTGPITAG